MGINGTEGVMYADGWVEAPSGRGTLNIIWSCFFTIFVACWTVLNLNLPSPEEGIWQIKLRKAKWMVVAVIVPEMLMAEAFAQRVAARKSVRVMTALGHKWTMQHAFFLNMGGIWLKPRESSPFPINAAQLSYLVADGNMQLPSISKKEIEDKSKADKFAKIIACGQILWLVLQCIGRAIQHLPITTLEIATLGFVIPSVATYALWFYKPADIEVPTFVPVAESTVELLERLSPSKYAWRQTPLDFVDTINAPSVTEIVLKTKHWPKQVFVGPSTRIRNDVFELTYSKLDHVFVFVIWAGYAGVHTSAWNFAFPSDAELILWRVASLTMTGSMFIGWILSNRKLMEKASSEGGKLSTIQMMLAAILVYTYLAARICLIVQVFLCLRKEPLGAFSTVNWTNYLPHI